ncbi:unnamed protein product [Gemmata massiliana]|uniref:DUF1918 domain-containing protein n=1 Tax=Gemmata massiliana TaxID=1210884 RepID=A0A6P2D3U8_9BACT|nr:unnamed protein product [Gemmata massiliana]
MNETDEPLRVGDRVRHSESDATGVIASVNLLPPGAVGHGFTYHVNWNGESHPRAEGVSRQELVLLPSEN